MFVKHNFVDVSLTRAKYLCKNQFGKCIIDNHQFVLWTFESCHSRKYWSIVHHFCHHSLSFKSSTPKTRPKICLSLTFLPPPHRDQFQIWHWRQYRRGFAILEWHCSVTSVVRGVIVSPKRALSNVWNVQMFKCQIQRECCLCHRFIKERAGNQPKFEISCLHLMHTLPLKVPFWGDSVCLTMMESYLVTTTCIFCPADSSRSLFDQNFGKAIF